MLHLLYKGMYKPVVEICVSTLKEKRLRYTPDIITAQILTRPIVSLVVMLVVLKPTVMGPVAFFMNKNIYTGKKIPEKNISSNKSYLQTISTSEGQKHLVKKE